jgi:D-arabinose 5-phosphate isomerase GutQ
VKNGTKKADDPNDFRLVEAWGMADGSKWVIAGSTIPKKYNTFKRKPQIYKGNPVLQASFGTNADDSEWLHDDEVSLAEQGLNYRTCMDNIGQHFMNEPTYYKSTIAALVYKVSNGYKLETIRGITIGTTAGTFMNNLFKADEGQSLKVHSAAGTELAAGDLLSLNDTLIVISADSANTTKYVLEVNELGLSSNAVLTSERYNIEITADPKSADNDQEDAGTGEITGFEYGTQLKTILANVTVPDGATLTVIDGKGAYVPLTVLNSDTVYVSQTVNPDIYFEVLAENGKTKIVYQLKPGTSDNDAFLLSTFYEVSQKDKIVKYVPRGTYVSTFFSNVTLSLGATAKILDNKGNERTQGAIQDDDKIVVTSVNGSVSNVYYISLQATQLVKTTYLAYVLSNKYHVDQVNYVITGPTGSTLLGVFMANIIPSMGASVTVVDIDGNERTSGDLNDGDRLKVTSADGAIEVIYNLALDLTSSEMLTDQQIEIYPNPTAGKLNIRGIEPGYRIQLLNSVGGVIKDFNAENSIEVLSLEDLPAGLFIIMISNENKIVGSFKAIRK